MDCQFCDKFYDKNDMYFCGQPDDGDVFVRPKLKCERVSCLHCLNFCQRCNAYFCYGCWERKHSKNQCKTNFNVYLLKNTKNNYTYLGYTNKVKDRIRKHNGEIKGGARYTKSRKGNGIWKYHLVISNLAKSEALSIERTAKNKRRRAIGNNPLEKRLNVLLPILNNYSWCVVNYYK